MRLVGFIPIVWIIFFVGCASVEEPADLMEEEVYFQLVMEDKVYEYKYALPKGYLSVTGGMGFVEDVSGFSTRNFLVFVDQADLLMIDIEANCTLTPGINSCFLANFTISQKAGKQPDIGVTSFLVGDYSLNNLRTADPDVQVFFEVEVTKTSEKQRLMEGNFRGNLFTQSPTGRVPERTRRVEVSGSFRVGIIGEVSQIALLKDRIEH